MRDNSAVLLPLDLHYSLIKSTYDEDRMWVGSSGTTTQQSGGCGRTPRMVTKACASWRGYPDK
eukprot:scaffold487504_cov23-Prasinocladus_malaysianus.AAC.1